jgi:hypothetical protein
MIGPILRSRQVTTLEPADYDYVVGTVVSVLDSEPGEPGSSLGACTTDA